MDKETSSRVSSIAGSILKLLTDNPDKDKFIIDRDDAAALAGSALSQDTTPGQTGKAGESFIDRLHREAAESALRSIETLKNILTV